MKRVLLFSVSLMVIGFMTGCGGSGSGGSRQSQGTEQGGDEQNPLEQKIIAEVLALPEMQFENAAAEIVEQPAEADGYYTVRAGSETESNFAVSFWFRVYAKPKFMINVYDLITDTEQTLDEWRSSTVEEPSETFHAYVKYDKPISGGQFRLLMDEVLWINGDDKETLKKYGFDPDNVDNDYELYNETEDWIIVLTKPESEFRISVYDDDGFPQYREVDHARFKKHLTEGDGRTILARVTISEGYAVSVNEVYIP
jgi:hypothetical protein